MRLIIALVFVAQLAVAQVDPTTAGLVYTTPEMEKVSVRRDLVYRTSGDTSLTYNVYTPTNKSEKLLPLVIFVNCVGAPALPQWKVYDDWSRLAAANGMMAITYQARQGKSLKDTKDVIDHLLKESNSLGFDKSSIGLWSCSGNVGVALPLAMDKSRDYIKSLVVYYGAGRTPDDNVVTRQDIELLIVRAGLDFYTLNTNIEKLVQSALAIDGHFEYINYPEGQHAFDIVDNTDRSKEIIKHTITFLKRTLTPGREANESFLLTNKTLWKMIVEEKKAEEALALLKKEVARYRAMSSHSPMFNHLIDDKNLNQMGYQLLNENRTEEAIQIFEANRELFSDSPLVYDALGDAFEQKGDHAKALTFSRTALDKLEMAKDIHPQMVDAIKRSAAERIKRLQ